MELRRRRSDFVLVGVIALAFGLGCSGSESSEAGTSGVPDGSSVTGMTGTSGTMDSSSIGTTGTPGTTGDSASTLVGPTSTMGTMGAVGTTGSVGGTTGVGAGGAVSSTGSGGNASSGGAETVGTSAGDTSTTGAAGTGGAGGGSPMDAVPSAGCGEPAGLVSGRASIEVGAKTREYILAVPDDYDPNHPYRLIFGWHPWGGSAEQTANMGYFGIESVSDGQAILVAPEGQDFQDGGLGWGNENGEDIDFLHAMLDRFGSELCIDQNRIFSTGFSFGAMFSFTLACSQSSMMRAIAPQAGNATTSGRCEDGDRSVATLAFIGTDDTLLSGHRQAVQIMVERNGCSAEPVTLESSWCGGLSSMYEPCTCVEYPDCKAGYPVISCEYKAGHQFAPNAGATLWDFFSQF